MNELWDNLICECGSKEFAPVIELRWKQGSGTAVRPTGNYFCVGCNKIVNTIALIETAKLKAKKRAIEELYSAQG